MIKSARRIIFFLIRWFTQFSLQLLSIITILARSRGINGCQALTLYYHIQNLGNCGCEFFSRCLFVHSFGRFSCVSIQSMAKRFHNCFSYGQNIKVRYFSSPIHFHWMDRDSNHQLNFSCELPAHSWVYICVCMCVCVNYLAK